MSRREAQESLTLKLRNGELDAILVTAPFSEPDVVSQPLFDEPFVLLLPADHRLASKTVIAAADLDPAEILLLAEGDRFRDQVLAAFPRLSPPQALGAAAKRNFTRGGTLGGSASHGGLEVGLTILPQTAAEAPLYAPQPAGHAPLCKPGAQTNFDIGVAGQFPAT